MSLPSVLDPEFITMRSLPECRAAAEERFNLARWPARTDQTWRFADLKRSSVENVSGSAGMEVERQGPWSDIRELDLDTGLTRHGDQFGRHLEESLGGLGASRHFAWGLKSDQLMGQCLVVEEGKRVDSPLVLETRVAGTGLASVVNLVLVRKGASVVLWERFRSATPEGAAFLVAGTVVVAEEGSEVTLVTSQELGRPARLVHGVHLVPGRSARVRSFSVNLGAGWVRQEVSVGLREPGSDCELYGLSLAGSGDEIDQRTLQAHETGGNRSDLLFKNVLFGDARSIFSGLIRVDAGAHGTDAFQTCRNLLLSEDAEANSMPGLEINADQVRCSHGSTCGQIDPEEVFYLRSRGIRHEDARHLVTLGFARDIVARIGQESVEEVLSEQVEARLRALRDESAQAVPGS